MKKADTGVEVAGLPERFKWVAKLVPCKSCNTVPKHYFRDRGSKHVVLCLICGSVEMIEGPLDNVYVIFRLWNVRNQPQREEKCGNCIEWNGAHRRTTKICRWNSCVMDSEDGYGCRGFSPKIKQL